MSKELFEKAKLKMFRQELLFFGLTSIKFLWNKHEFDESVEGYVCLDYKTDQTFDRMIHLNSKYLDNNDYTHINLAWLIIHEVLHVLHRHGSRGKNKKKEIWAVATDHVIERTIKSWMHDGKQILRPYKDNYNIVNDLHKALPRCSEEEAYDWLHKNKQFITIKIKGGGDGSNGNGQEDNGPNVAQVIDQHGNVLQESVIHEDKDTPAHNNEVDNIISEARATLQTLKDRGVGTSGMVSYLEKLLKIEIPWETILRKCIKTNVIYKPTDRAWYRPNKFLRPIGIYTPGESLEESKEGVGILVLHVDTSGSMSDKELKKALHVIMESLQYFEKIVAIIADYSIHDIKEFEKDDFTSFWAFVKKGLKGRGGTSHKKVFEYCQDKIYDEDPDMFSMFISFTDGYSDIDHQINNYPWCKRVPMIFLMTSDYNLDNVKKNYSKLEVINVK